MCRRYLEPEQTRSASKDSDLEDEYAKFLKESSIHEKAIARDLGRLCIISLIVSFSKQLVLGRSLIMNSFVMGKGLDRKICLMY